MGHILMMLPETLVWVFLIYWVGVRSSIFRRSRALLIAIFVGFILITNSSPFVIDFIIARFGITRIGSLLGAFTIISNLGYVILWAGVAWCLLRTEHNFRIGAIKL
jgi:hypothetical protein